MTSVVVSVVRAERCRSCIPTEELDIAGTLGSPEFRKGRGLLQLFCPILALLFNCCHDVFLRRLIASLMTYAAGKGMWSCERKIYHFSVLQVPGSRQLSNLVRLRVFHFSSFSQAV
jgi:hypothetical protein